MKKSLQQRFDAYHHDNPKVYDLFKEYAFKAINAGYTTLSAKFIFEAIRWKTTVETAGDRWKMNNNYRAYYARLFMKDHPQYGAIFKTRATQG